MVHNRQLAAWIVAGASFACAHASGGLSWYFAAPIVLAQGALLLYIMYLAPSDGYAPTCLRVLGRWAGRAVLLFTAVWTALMAGFAARLAAEAFPAVQGYPMIPLTVLALSAWAAHNSDAVGARVGAVLLPFLAVFFLLIVCFGWKEVEEQAWMHKALDLRAACVITLPLGAVLLQRGEGAIKAGLWIAFAALMAAALALVSAPFGGLYQATMSISVFGVMERFEALLSAAMAAGGICLCALLGRAGLSAMRKAAEQRKAVMDRLFWIIAVAGIALSERQDTNVLMVCSLLFWVALPVLILWMGKAKKDEKRC